MFYNGSCPHFLAMKHMEKIEDPKNPNDLKYKKIFDKGKPMHNADDPFLIRHPRMDLSRRAKIFAPFDALRGFDAAIIAKNEIYENRPDSDNRVQEETIPGKKPHRISAVRPQKP